MQKASQFGAITADGLGMLVEQAAEAFAIWRGVKPITKDIIKMMRDSL
jgi:shikimate dehydrogenase